MADWSRVGAEHVREAAALYESGERRPAKPARNTFLLLEGGCYPAKFVRMLAHEMATGVALDPSVDLSGGMETVRFLNRLGFDVKHAGRVFAGAGAATPRRTGGTKGPLSTSFHSAEGAMKKGIAPVSSPGAQLGAHSHQMAHDGGGGPVVVTACIDVSREWPDNETQLAFLEKILGAVARARNAPALVVLPGGFLFAYKKRLFSLIEHAAQRVGRMLVKMPVGSAVCMSIDGDNWHDQIGVAFMREGVAAMGRKYHPAPGEEITPAASAYELEQGKPRTFIFAGHSVYLAVCYDGFGIAQGLAPRRAADLVVDLVHFFRRPGEKEGGSVDFARKGLAGAARQWRVPVFAAVHFQAGVQERWPTGVVWRRGNQSVRSWRYDDNPLSPMVTEWVEHGDEAAHLKFYNLGHAIRASSASTRSA